MAKLTILVVGGAGYIGSHVVKHLLAAGHWPVTLDNLSSGHRDAVMGGDFFEGDLADRLLLDELFRKHAFDGVMHFSSFIEVGESVRDPSRFYCNNVMNTLALLDAMVAHRVQRLVFSSTAAVYGTPQYTPIDEAHPTQPINPYGWSKYMVEQILRDYDHAYGLKSISLRYFNAAGADPEGQLSERHDPETHLIPLLLQTAAGLRDSITVYGRDYPTADGTCVRDYIHVSDLAAAHERAMEHLVQGGETGSYNLANGDGYSVQQVIDAARKITGREIPCLEGLRRAGDPAVLVADAQAARRDLKWVPRFTGLETIIEHAWNTMHGNYNILIANRTV